MAVFESTLRKTFLAVTPVPDVYIMSATINKSHTEPRAVGGPDIRPAADFIISYVKAVQKKTLIDPSAKF